jgi:SPP1 family predicted phage head-tail adaptor
MARAGEYRNRIKLRKPVHTLNSFLESITTYITVATVWAAIDWESGRRFESAKQLNAETQGVIRIRYRTDIRPDWRIQYGNRCIEILSIANLKERDAELVMNCKEADD